MILQEDRQYTFAEIFELNTSISSLLAELGYRFGTEKLDLPRQTLKSEATAELQAKFYRRLPRISFSSETARREFMISDILSELLDYSEFQIEVEYSAANQRLHGNIDYLLQGIEESTNRVVVIEAKNDEMERGFQQLAVELIATADQLELNQLYGAVTTGEFWRFGKLNREMKEIIRDLDSFSVPTGLHDVMEILAGLTS
ncbi:MAG: hypothetical protein AAF702_31665 [Chloroflexota bacterium]